MVIDFGSVLSPHSNGKVESLKDTPEWEKEHAPALLSVISGGQWPQTRKATVRKWEITYKRCQLCFEADGTYEHRYHCKTTMPRGGWSTMTDKAALAAGRIGGQRMRILRATGLPALKLPLRPDTTHDTFEWDSAPPDP